MRFGAILAYPMVFNFDVRTIWRSRLSARSSWRVRPVLRRIPLFYVTILATLCIKGLKMILATAVNSYSHRFILWFYKHRNVLLLLHETRGLPSADDRQSACKEGPGWRRSALRVVAFGPRGIYVVADAVAINSRPGPNSAPYNDPCPPLLCKLRLPLAANTRTETWIQGHHLRHSVSLCLHASSCSRSWRKTAWAINTEVSRDNHRWQAGMAWVCMSIRLLRFSRLFDDSLAGKKPCATRRQTSRK